MKQGYLMILTLELVVTSLFFCKSESSNPIRLQGPLISSGIGRVEIFHQGKWGTVCDDSWDLNDAEVVCRQLGFAGAVEALQGSEVPDGTGTIWLDNVACVGSEQYLANCGHQGWENHNCGHGEDAGVRCNSIRLQGPLISSGTGRVEIFHQGKWGTVCDDSWDLNDAKVVCRELGFAGAEEALEVSDGVPDGTGTIWLDEVACVGNEQHLADCSHPGWENHDCSHGEDAGVRCDVTVPAKGPTISTITSPRATKLIVIWSKLSEDDANGDITSYTVCYQLTSSGSGVSCSISKTVGGADDTTTVILSGLNEATTYDVSVKATNRGGTGDLGTKKSGTTLEAKPAKGSTISTITSPRATELTVVWSKLSADDANGYITSYTVCYQVTSSGSGVSCTNNQTVNGVDTTTVTLRGLNQATTYDVAVKATTGAGTGDLGTKMSGKTLEAIPAKGPTISTITSPSPTELTVVWSMLSADDANGVITSYTVCYQLTSRESDVSCTNSETVNGADTTTVTLRGLNEATTYDVAVKATNGAGTGVLSAKRSGTTGEALPVKGPTIGTITSPGATELTVIWFKLSHDDANGDITSYTVCYQLTSSGGGVSCSNSEKVNGADTTTVTLRDLNEATTYDVAVKATNRAGTGVLSAKRSGTTGEAAPTKGPVLVSLSVESSTELNVAWLALSADDSNGIITQYQICFNSTDAGGDLCSQNIKSVIANTLTYTLTGLNEATTYEVAVRAKNAAGTGPLGNTLKRKTFEVEREKPTITKLLAYFSSIKILWEYPKVLDGRITKNEVCITRPRICKSVAGEKRSVTLTHLIPRTKYNITVQGFTSAGAVQRVKVQARTQISQINNDLFTDSRSLGVDVHETQVSFKLPSLTATETNEIHFIQVIVKRLFAGEKFEALRHIPEKNLTTYDTADGGFLPYITLRQNSYENEKLIVVGNGESSSNSLVQKNKLANVYINGPLKENTEYAILLRVYYDGDAYSSSGILQVKTKDAKSSSSMSIVLIVVIVIVIVAAFLVVFGIVCLRRGRNKRNNMNGKESRNINIGNPVYDDASPNNSNNCLASDLANVMLPENVYEAVADILPKRDPTTCGNYSGDVDGQTSTQENTYMELNIKKDKEENLYASLN